MLNGRRGRRRQPFGGLRAGLALCAESAAQLILGLLSVVARDGIEPPTPAFSGLRSTTELSGLSL
jgi:hypothetical protein